MHYRRPSPDPDPLVEDLFDEATKPADAVPVSEAFESYLAKRKELLAIRTAAGGWYSREEDPVIADMDDLWST